MAKHSRRIVKDLSAAAGGKKVAESDILEKLEKMCDPDADDGEWLTQIDIVEEGTSLQLKDTGRVGKCKTECRTIARVCEQINEEIDLTDLSAMLYKGKKRAAVTNWMCHDATDVCSRKPPAVPKDRRAGEAHEPMDEEELRNTRMLRSMKASGLSGSMYSRESLEEELAEMKEQYGDDPDFEKVMKDTGMDDYVPKKPADREEGAPQPAAGADGAEGGSAAGGGLQGAVARAGGLLREGASRVAEGVAGLAGKLLGGRKKAGGEL